MTAPAHQKLGIPEAQAAARSVRAWASAAPVLAGLLGAGMDEGAAAARFGLHLLKENLAGDAATVFRAAIALAPAEADLWTNLGVALDRTQALAEAATALEQSVALAQAQPDIWVFLGVVRGKLGLTREAEAAYRAALALEPGSATAWQCLGLLKEQQRELPAAIEALRESQRLGPGGAAISANLGKLHYQLGRVQEAREAYADAARAEPDNPHYQRMLRKARFLCDAIEGSPVDEALEQYSPTATAQAERADPEQAAADRRERIAWLEVATGLLTGLGHREAAIRLCKKRLELEPASAAARYLFDTLSGRPLERAPADYIVESFDAFAGRFDEQLVGVLRYDVPEQLCAAIQAATAATHPAGHRYDALDAGCGTGLCGPLLRPLSRKLTGVDLSPKMLEQAGRRGVYDSLVCAELIEFLGAHARAFDLLTAADVLLYFGELDSVFAGAAAALRPGGLFALSTELLLPEPGQAPAPGGYRVLTSGRFTHAPAYVRKVAAAAFAEETCLETTLRLDSQVRVRGNIFLFRRRADHF